MSTRNISWGVKAARCVLLTNLPPPYAVVMKSGNLSLLEPSGPVQACNGIDLPLPLPYSCVLSVDCFVVAVPEINFDISDADNAMESGMWFEFYNKEWYRIFIFHVPINHLSFLDAFYESVNYAY
jgi:hypothetical protein